MTRIWSESDGQYIDVHVINCFGPKATEHVIDHSGWRTRGDHLTDHAPAYTPGGFPSAAELAKVPLTPDAVGYNNRPKSMGPAGRRSQNPNRTRICACGRKKAIDATVCCGCRLGRPQRAVQAGPRATYTHCATCPTSFTAAQQRNGLKHCKTCRGAKKRPLVGPYARRKDKAA